MDEERLRQLVKDLVGDLRIASEAGRGMSLRELATIQPGLGRIMPEIGARTWKLYYAGKAQNWPNALYQWKEGKKLFELGAFTRPKHQPALEAYLRDDWAPIGRAIEQKDLAGFLAAMDRAVESANVWHDRKAKPYIRWKVPDAPPPDLDLTPRE